MSALLITINCNAQSTQLKSAFDAALTALVFFPESTIVLLSDDTPIDEKTLHQASQMLIDNFGIEPLQWFSPSDLSTAPGNPVFTGKSGLSNTHFRSLLQGARTVINL